MLLAKSKKLFLLSLITCIFLNANDHIDNDFSLNEKILSKDRLELFELEQNQIEQDSAQLKKDWINPINYSWTKTNGETYTTESSAIVIDQPIFKVGGIYKAIIYADSVKDFSEASLELEKKSLIKDATNILFNIHKINYEIKRQELLVKNGKINVQVTREQVLNGFADTTELDNTILDTNERKNNLVDLKFEKKELINSFADIASGNYTSFILPTLKLIEKDIFIKNNLNIKIINADIESKDNLSWMTTTQYLPELSATFDYTKYHTTTNPNLNDDAKNYGLKITIPLDSRALNDIESSRIDYLKAKLDLRNSITEEDNFFKNSMEKLEKIKEKEKISMEDFLLYDSLLAVMIEEKEAGLKTQSDVDLISNSRKIKEYELEIYKLDKQIELLEIYARVN